MGNTIKWLLAAVILLVALYAGCEWGKKLGKNDGSNVVIENYSFVREIAEMASLEVNGTTTYKTSNLANDGSWTGAFKKRLFENSTTITIPYTAKYGVVLNDSTMRIVRKDSLVEIYLPEPSLLSYELKMNKLESMTQKGWFVDNDEVYFASLQKKLYEQSRTQLEQNAMYLEQSRQKVCGILQKYFATLGMKSVCIYQGKPSTVAPLKG